MAEKLLQLEEYNTLMAILQDALAKEFLQTKLKENELRDAIHLTHHGMDYFHRRLLALVAGKDQILDDLKREKELAEIEEVETNEYDLRPDDTL